MCINNSCERCSISNTENGPIYRLNQYIGRSLIMTLYHPRWIVFNKLDPTLAKPSHIGLYCQSPTFYRNEKKFIWIWWCSDSSHSMRKVSCYVIYLLDRRARSSLCEAVYKQQAPGHQESVSTTMHVYTASYVSTLILKIRQRLH